MSPSQLARLCRFPALVARWIAVELIGFVAWIPLGLWTCSASCGMQILPAESDLASAEALCREYLESDDDLLRSRLSRRLEAYDGEIELVIAALSRRRLVPLKAGYHPELTFVSPAMQEKYPNDLLYFIVPDSYDQKKPTGLIVFLHGGGLNTSRDAAMYTMQLPDSDSSSPSDFRSGRMLAATGMITVGPSAPGKGKSAYRWCLKESEQYILDVIEDSKSRFNIDPDRIFLLGHSMGGFGAFHHALKQPDRFAAIIVSSGAWDCGFWPVLRGTPMCIVQGRHDAEKGSRWHYTDVAYARRTVDIFQRERLEYTYFEHDGTHGFSENRADIARYFDSAKQLQRDPYFPHIALATPQGFTWSYLNRVRHNRWLSIDETLDGKIEVDELDSQGEDFDEWRLVHRRSPHDGASLEANNRGNNEFEVIARNIKKFTVWLHPQMIDMNTPIVIAVNGREQFRGLVKPSLTIALQSYERRHDWGMIYPIKVTLPN